MDFAWWKEYKRAGLDVFLHDSVKQSLDRLDHVGEKYAQALEAAVEATRSDLWPRIGGAIPPMAGHAVECVIAGDEPGTDVGGVQVDAIRASVSVLRSDERLSKAREMRDSLQRQITAAREEIRRVSEKYAP